MGLIERRENVLITFFVRVMTFFFFFFQDRHERFRAPGILMSATLLLGLISSCARRLWFSRTRVISLQIWLVLSNLIIAAWTSVYLTLRKQVSWDDIDCGRYIAWKWKNNVYLFHHNRESSRLDCIINDLIACSKMMMMMMMILHPAKIDRRREKQVILHS